MVYFESREIHYDRKGYACIYKKGIEYKIHVLVWEAVNGEKPEGYDIHHIDRNKANFDISNLQLLSPKAHRRIHAGWIMENGEWVAKPCNICHRILPLSEFYFVRTRGIQSNYCKTCHNENTKNIRSAWSSEAKEARKIYNREYARKHYGKYGDRVAK